MILNNLWWLQIQGGKMQVSKRETRKYDAGRVDLKTLNDVIHNSRRVTSRTGMQLWRTRTAVGKAV